MGGGAQAAPKNEEKKEEKKEEPKKEKEIVDIELSSFDAAKKINLIKEVRTLFGLGLKEAKEMVEKSPVILKKGVKREETEAIIKKISDAGGQVTLK
jgi:large subunit ribosomal protein L7/L12